MKKILSLLIATLLCATSWAEVKTLTLDELGASLTSTSNTSVKTVDITATGTSDTYTLNYLQGKKQNSSILLAKSTGAFISNSTPIPGAIQSITVYINSGASGKTTYHCAFSTSECTTAYTTGSTAVNIAGGKSNTYDCSVENAYYFCISLGNANNGQVLKLEISYDAGGGDKTPTTLTWSDQIKEAQIGDTGIEYPTLTTDPADLTGITYSSSNEAAATIDANTGEITLVDEGTTEITASFAGDDTYDSSSAKYTLHVHEAADIYVHDVLDADLIGVTSYKNWTGIKATDGSDAVYAGNSTKYNGTAIQIRTTNSNSGIVTTTSGGKIRKIKATWNSGTTSGRTIDIYGKNTAYTSAADLYSSDSATQGEYIGSIVYGTSIKLTISDDYKYVGIRSNDGALYLDEIDLAWEEVEKHTITIGETEHGTVTTSPSEKAAKDDVVTITATPNEGYEVTDISVGDEYDPDHGYEVANNQFTMEDWDVTVNVTFGLKNYDVTLEQPETGGTIAADAETATMGSTVTLTATPEEGYQFQSWTVLKDDLETPVEVTDNTFTMPACDVMVSATFVEYSEKDYVTFTGVPESLQLTEEDEYNLSVSVTEGDYTGTLSYASSDDNVAMIDATSGEILALTAGTTTITITAPEDDNYRETVAEFVLTVIAPQPNRSFYESFDGCAGTGGNDDKWSGSIASSTFNADNTWSTSNESGANQCAKFGASKKQGSATTPAIGLTGNGYLVFKAGAWSGDATGLNVSIDNGTLSESSVTLADAAWTTYALNITGSTAESKITFTAQATEKNRFFLDEVRVAQGCERTVTSGNFGTFYTTEPVAASDFVGGTPYKVVGKVMDGEALKCLVFEEMAADEIMASNSACIFQATDTRLVTLYSDDEGTVNNAGLVGAAEETNVPEGCYVLSGNKLRKVAAGADARIAANRAYIDLSEIDEYNDAASSSRVLFFNADGTIENGGTTTGINSLVNTQNSKTFDLQGRRVNHSVKGQLYINNGKKVLF